MTGLRQCFILFMTGMDYLVPQYVLIGVGVATVLLAVLTITANGLLLFVIYKDRCKCLRRPSTGFIATLSVTNLMTGLVTDITYAVAILEGLSDGSVNLQLRTPTILSGFITYTSEILLVVALTLERVLANGFVAFHRNHFRFQTTVIASCFIWLYSVCFALLQFFKINDHSYLLADIYLHHAAPIIVITLANVVLYFVIRRHHRAIIPARVPRQIMPNSQVNSQQTLQARRERQLAIVVMIIGLLLFLSLVPYLVIVNLVTFCCSCDQNVLQTALVLCVPIIYLNAVINPYLYAWRLPQYKRSFKAVLPKCMSI